MEGDQEGLENGHDAVDGGASAVVHPLPWASRLSAMPYLPGGGSNQIEILHELLRAVLEKDGLLTATITGGSGQELSLRDALKPLSTTGFVRHVDRDHCALTVEALSWVESRSDAALLSIVHRHIRFVGELLNALQDAPLSVRNLMEVARDRYELAWKSPDQMRRRVTWLICMGAVEYRTATLLAITERGRSLAKDLELHRPTIAADDSSTRQRVDITEPPSAIAMLLAALNPEILAGRNPTLGYVPTGRGEATVIDALQALVNACSPSSTKSELMAFAERTFGVSPGSFGATLTTLTRSHLIEQTSLNVYEPTPPARAWLETADPLDLALVVHAHYLFVLEIIPLLKEYDRAPDLARAGVDFYGLQRPDTSGIRTRLHILKAAGLISERAQWRYRATALGKEIAARVPLQNPIGEGLGRGPSVSQSPPEGGDQGGPVNVARSIGRELATAGRDSDSPARLEVAISRAFEFLGFQAQHVGGGGRTDVLATTNNSDLTPVRVIVDAKSARSGVVAESAVSFDTLRDHRAQHQADHVVLVGPNFDAGRVRKRAEQNHVALLTTEELADVLARHARTPLSTHDYVGLLSSKDDDLRALEVYWSAAEQRTALLAQVVSVLAQEARDSDEVTQGALTSDQIYLIAREARPAARPHPEDIEAVLGLLQHPLVNSVHRAQADRGRAMGYQLIDSPNLVQTKLLALARALDGLGDQADES